MRIFNSQGFQRLPLCVMLFAGLAAAPRGALAQQISTDAPPLSPYADTEATTNVVFYAGDTDDRLFRLSLELNATASNNVSVAFGTDSNTNGVLDHAEIDAAVGWDSGSWFCLDRVSGAEARVTRPDGHRRLDWELTMNSRRTAKSVKATDGSSIVFTGAFPSAMFSPDWNLMQVTARGLSEPGGIVVSEVSGWGFSVILR